MDYCHHCQRHLNGALACAGCGTPAEELRLHDPVPHEAEVVLVARENSRPETADGPRRAARSSRRRELSRRERREMRDRRGSHRRRGRTVLITVLGLGLAAGALSLAELALESSGDDGDATSVQEDRAIELDGGQPSEAAEEPEEPGRVEGTPTRTAGTGSPTGDGSPDPSASEAESGPPGGESPSPRESVAPSDEADPSGSPGPSGSASASGSPSTSGRPNQPPPPSASAPPPPQEEDDCFLWFICT